MREDFKRLKTWIEMCPVEAAMRIEELEAKNESLEKQLDAKVVLVNNGWEEERYILQTKVVQYETVLGYYASRGFNKAVEVLEEYK
ncbi:hypothetical protein K7T73_12735 [Bacillus badius]|uniref:hypothetical protein n=1 Tax=Bacillus badius TaxID=1455 RepID=UPI001CBBE903|nr:hypothetical protein [Bacillus badius]UAT29466.1 hypothetical protein K7T73_12735 [Bacillus badius]